MSELPRIRRELARALDEWAQAGGDVEPAIDHIEGLISAKVDEILQAREDNARAGLNRT